MDLFVQIGLGVLVLATLILAFLASKKWHWAHVLVVVGLVFASIGYALLLTPSMLTRIKFQKQFAEADAEFERTAPLVEALQHGTSDANKIGQLRSQGIEAPEGEDELEGVSTLEEKFRLSNRLRGRLWLNAQPGAVDQQTGEVTLTIEEPSPLGIEDGALLFVFEQGAPSPNSPSDGAQYLGEFRVAGLGEQSVTLTPVQEFDAREAQRLINSRGPWILHETMPVDDPTLFTGQPEEAIRALIPEAVVDEYLRENTPWTADDGEETRFGFDENDVPVGPEEWDQTTRFVYRRQLRDYSAAFQEFARQRVELLADIQAVTADNVKLAAALESAKKVQAAHEETGRQLRHDLAGVQRDQQAIQQHLAAVQRQAAKAEMLLAQTLAANTQLVAELTAAQQAASGRDLQNDPTPSRGAVDIDAL